MKRHLHNENDPPESLAKIWEQLTTEPFPETISKYVDGVCAISNKAYKRILKRENKLITGCLANSMSYDVAEQRMFAHIRIMYLLSLKTIKVSEELNKYRCTPKIKKLLFDINNNNKIRFYHCFQAMWTLLPQQKLSKN